MVTHVRTPQDVFMQPQHHVVPAFQRPYVWEKEEQWVPLWQDVRRLAELRLGRGHPEVLNTQLGHEVLPERRSAIGQ